MARRQRTVSKVSLTKNTSKRRKNMRRVGKAIKTKTPTIDDVNILLRLSELYNTAIDFEAAEWFWAKTHKDEIPSSIQEFKDKYPQGSRDFQLFERFTSKFELAGLLIKYGFLNECLYFDRFGSLRTEWERSKDVIMGIRKEWDDPQFRENFELLSVRASKWFETHPQTTK
jgi:hypothetical protein